MDIKPANFLLDSQGNYVLSDFGLSSRVADLIHQYDKNKTIGAVAYMPPERCLLDGKVDVYSDIWSLGVSIYQLITGELPFGGCGGEYQFYGRILTLQCEKCSKKLSNLIDACINPNPQYRPTAAEIIVLADAVIKGDSNDTTAFEIAPPKVASDNTVFRKPHPFHNTYNETILAAMKRYKIAKSTDKPLYGIVDERGRIIVDFLYDEIHNLGEYAWPGPGPLSSLQPFFIGAFFRQGKDAGYLIMKEDGCMTEYKRCSYEEFKSLCILT